MLLEDTDASPNDVLSGSYYGHPRQTSEEIRLTSPEQRPRWIAELYYFHEDLNSSAAYSAPGFGPSVFSRTSGDLEGVGQLSSLTTHSYARWQSGFRGQERLKLSLGLRLTHEAKNLTYDAHIDNINGFLPNSLINGPIIATSAIAQTIDFPAGKSWNNFSGRGVGLLQPRGRGARLRGHCARLQQWQLQPRCVPVSRECLVGQIRKP